MSGHRDSDALIPNAGSIQYSEDDSLASQRRGFDQAEKLRVKSLRAIYLTNFLSAVGFSILMNSVWPFLQKINGPGEATQKFLGYVVGAFSLGQLIGAPFWGSLTVNNSYKVGGIPAQIVI